MNVYQVDLVAGNIDTIAKMLTVADFFTVSKDVKDTTGDTFNYVLTVHSRFGIQGVDKEMIVKNTSLQSKVIGFKPLVLEGDKVIAIALTPPSSDMGDYIEFPMRTSAGAQTDEKLYMGYAKASKSEFYSPFDGLEIRVINE